MTAAHDFEYGKMIQMIEEIERTEKKDGWMKCGDGDSASIYILLAGSSFFQYEYLQSFLSAFRSSFEDGSRKQIIREYRSCRQPS